MKVSGELTFDRRLLGYPGEPFLGSQGAFLSCPIAARKGERQHETHIRRLYL